MEFFKSIIFPLKFNLIDAVEFLAAIVTITGFSLRPRLNRSKKQIKCRVQNEAKITKDISDIEGLEIQYDEKKIEWLTITYITFWNNSISTIYETDITGEYSFDATVNKGDILDCFVKKGANTKSKIEVCAINSIANITFGSLSHFDGGIIVIYHTGAEDSVNISKKINGGIIKTIVYQEKNLKWNIFVGVGSFILMFVILIAFFTHFMESKEILLIITIISFIAMKSSMDKKREKSFIPKNCR